MNGRSDSENTGCREVKKSSTLRSALVVVGGGLAAAPATALELGDIKVHSTLGQPLRASIQYALGPHEAVSDTCVTLAPTRSADGLPSIDQASMIVAGGVIAITGSSIVREPLVTMRVNIRCQYTAQLTRDYMMFIDPAGTATQPVAAPATTQIASPSRQSAPALNQPAVAVRRRPANREPIGDVTRYQVRPGDSLSEIVQRIENRPIALWPAVNAIFDANPNAFIDNDPNKLKAGSWLLIPDFVAGDSATSAVAARVDSTSSEPANPGSVYDPATIGTNDAAAIVVDNSATVDAPTATADNPLADLQPGDVILGSDNPIVSPVDSVSDGSVVITDTSLEGPITNSSSPNVPVATIQPATPAEPTKTNWLLWLGGGGIAIIIGLLLFGRRFRGQFGSAPIGAAAVPQRRRSDTMEVEALSDGLIVIPDDSPTEENLALDADLIVGTGLQEGTDVDVAQDFGFAATTDLDLELPEEMSSGTYGELPETDIIPPFATDVESILESEVLPGEDDYDMSVIVDATKMPHPDDVTEKDLEAIQVPVDDETLITGDYTVDQDVDYKILEQDYEDEMTATQALNFEIQKAAEDLAVRMDDDIDAETTEMPLATVHELDVTAQLPSKDAVEAKIGDDDDTGVNPTVNMDTEDKTVEMTQDSTVEMPKGDTKAG